MRIGEFEQFIILEWYDGVISTVFKIDNKFYFCSLLEEDRINDDYIYGCISLEFFVECITIMQIIESNSFKENWEKLYDLFNQVQEENTSYLIKTKDLQFGNKEVVKYKDNFNWNINILFTDYPDCIYKATKIDNWREYFK